jgi:hypothetical protein
MRRPRRFMVNPHGYLLPKMIRVIVQQVFMGQQKKQMS